MNQQTNAGDTAKRAKPLSEKSQVSIRTTLITVLGSVLVAGFTTVGTIYATKSTVAQATEGASKAKTSVDELKNRVAEAAAMQNSIAVPVATIIAYAGSIADETVLKRRGWLPCDGRAVSRTEYSNLWEVIKQAWGEGDRGTTFNLPDLRGVFLRGVNQGRSGPYADPDASNRTTLTTGGSSGDSVGSFQGDALQNIKGTIGDFNDFGAFKGGLSAPFAATPNRITSTGVRKSDSSDHYDRIDMDLSRVARTSTETRPKNASVYYLIKY